MQLCRYAPLDTSFVRYRQPAKGRHKVNRSGKPCRSKYSKASASRNRAPWLLVTSLPNTHNLAKRVVGIYKTRMQREEGFRDMKSHRYGSVSYTQIPTKKLVGIFLNSSFNF